MRKQPNPPPPITGTRPPPPPAPPKPSKQHGKRGYESQGKYFTDRMEALTAEDLRGKAEIAAELSHRDIIIAKLRQALGAISYKAENIDSSEWEEAVWTIRDTAMKALNE